MERKHPPEMEAFYRKWTLPEEDKAEPTFSQCRFRWFRSENVICIEHYRRSETLPERKAS
jgi:hypothetical protein